MDISSGDIRLLTNEENEKDAMSLFREHNLVEIKEKDISKLKHMAKPQRKNWMRNKPCICESGLKFKNCCWSKYK